MSSSGLFSPEQGLVVAERYSLVREIGRGGMGSVWEARDLQLDAPCALKFILEHMAGNLELRKRFLREARAVAQLPSPHVVSIRGVGEHEGALYTSMELLRGETLDSRLERERVLDPVVTLEVVRQVASVLMLAHAAGITHRDLKPENIWLWEGEGVFAKVIDFGVAKHVLATSMVHTKTGAIVGTPRYMSPEQAAGKKTVDHRSDVWSLAVIAVQCLSGECAFDGDCFGDVLVKILQTPIPALGQLYPDASDPLQAWWAQATQRNPEERFQSAMALAESFAAALRPSLLPRLSHSRVLPVSALARTEEVTRLPITRRQVSNDPTGATQDSLPPTELAPDRSRWGRGRQDPGTRLVAADQLTVVPASAPLEKLPLTRVGWVPVLAAAAVIGSIVVWQVGAVAPRAASTGTEAAPVQASVAVAPVLPLAASPAPKPLAASPVPEPLAAPLPAVEPRVDEARGSADQPTVTRVETPVVPPVVQKAEKVPPARSRSAVNATRPKPAKLVVPAKAEPPRPSVDGRVGF